MRNYKIGKTENYQIPLRCPTCNCNWWLFPPVGQHGSKSKICVECKDVFPTEENENDI